VAGACEHNNGPLHLSVMCVHMYVGRSVEHSSHCFRVLDQNYCSPH
jgi:hypothetical protein